ncbi:MAG: hypothetical protein HWN68_20820, partial [Desulfobacterales bacterium]|nr:hypothetical protein [Desulfobacterales bacterium]
RDNIVDIINGAKSLSEAFIDFGKTLQTQVADAFWNLAVEAAKAAEWTKAAWLGAASIIVSVFNTVIKGVLDYIFGIEEASERVQTAWGEFASSWTLGAREMGEYLKDLANRFSEVGLAISNTIEAAQRKLQGLYKSIEDLDKSTREKLIAELDKYYDYRVLKEMDLSELMELSAKTRAEIEAGTLEEVAESAEEAAVREKDAKVNALQAIEDAHKQEMDLINQKILLTKIEIKLMEYQAIGWVRDAKKKLELQKELNDLLDEYDETYGEVAESTEDATEAAKEYGREGRRAGEDVRDSLEMVRQKMAEAREASRGFRDDIGKIPREIAFDVIGKLGMPSIPRIGTQYFDIVGEYRAPYIELPKFQMGIPYIPRT